MHKKTFLFIQSTSRVLSAKKTKGTLQDLSSRALHILLFLECSLLWLFHLYCLTQDLKCPACCKFSAFWHNCIAKAVAFPCISCNVMYTERYGFLTIFLGSWIQIKSFWGFTYMMHLLLFAVLIAVVVFSEVPY